MKATSGQTVNGCTRIPLVSASFEMKTLLDIFLFWRAISLMWLFSVALNSLGWQTHHTQISYRFQHLFVCLILFLWQLLLCVHRHEKELQNTKKINVTTVFRLRSVSASVKWLRARVKNPGWSSDPNMKISLRFSKQVQNRCLISYLHSAGKLDKARDHFSPSWYTEEKKELIPSVWKDPTRKSPFIYKTDPRGRFPVNHYKDHEWQYFTSSTSEVESCCH